MPFLNMHQFKAMARRKTVPADALLHKQMATVIVPMADRQVRFVISTSTVDREGDVVSQAGWDLDNFRRNPVVLWGHDHDHLPVGKAVEIDIEGDALHATVEFVPAEMPHVGDKAEAILRMCKTGFLSATSVGFRPIEYDIANERDEGDSWMPPMNFLRQELLEFSIVSIPCNPQALIEVPSDMAALIAQQSADDNALEEARAAEIDVAKQAAIRREAAKARRHAAVEDLRIALGA